MNRIFYSCLLFVLVFISGAIVAQPSFSISPNPQCYNPTNTYTAEAAIVAQFPGATSYSWAVTSPSCTPSFTVNPTSAIPGTSINITIPCCGDYSVNCIAFLGAIPVGTVAQNVLFSGGFSVGVIYCPTNSGTVTITPSVVCLGSQVTVTGLGANTYTWNNNIQGNTFITTPTVNTCYTFTGTTAQGCSITAAAQCVSVQAITATASPASQTMCLGSPVSFTASGTVTTGTNVTGGTTITGYEWFAPGQNPPGPPSLSTTATATDPATPGGTYSVIVTHNGAAGTCTLQALAAVVIGTSIPVSISASSQSVCPGGSVTLTAVSAPTTALGYTWYQNSPGPGFSFIQTGNPIVRNPGLPILPRTYSVNVDYGGCPGTATIQIGLLALTPTLTSSTGLFTCPNRSLVLTASGGTTYTFTAYAATTPATGTVITKPLATTFTVAHTPQAAWLPIQYCVNTASSGCTGSTCITVTQRTLNPILTPSTPSICPNTQFTLTTTGVTPGPTTNYTFSSNYNANIAAGSASAIVHTPPAPNLPIHSYTVDVDSLGCLGQAQVTVGLLILRPQLTTATPSVCPNSQVTFTSTGGAGTTYSFYAPTFATPVTSSLIVTANNTDNYAADIAPMSGTQTPGTYTVLVDSVGCKGTGTITIHPLNFSSLMTLTSTPATGSICPGSTVSLIASGAMSYTFTAPSGGTVFATGASSSPFSAIHSPATIGAAGVTYTVYGDSLSCIGSKTITIREHKLNPTISLSPTLVCAGMTTTITAGGVIAGPNVTYSFYTVAGPPLSFTALGPPTSFSFTTDNPVNTTAYTVLVDSAGCTPSPFAFPSATIQIRPGITLVPSASSTSVCPGLTTTLSVAGPTIGAPTFSWSQIAGTGSITPVNPTPTIIANPVTNSTYSINGIDSLGCVGSTVISVGIDPSQTFPVLLGSSGSTICSGQSVVLTSTVTTPSIFSNNTGWTYTWSPFVNLSPTPNDFSVSASPSVTTVYTLLVTNGYGCYGASSFTVPVGTYPNMQIIPTANAICPGFTSTLTAFGANTYTWTSPSGSFTGAIVQQSISVPIGQYSVVGSNGGGCISSTVITIVQSPSLNITVSQSSPTTCITNNSPKFSKPVHLTASGAGSYVWYPYNPNHMTYSLGPQTDVRPPASTCYTVIGSTAICAGQTVVCVNVIPQFSMNVDKPLPAICLGDSLTLGVINIGTLAVGPASAFTYSWTEALNAPPISISNYFTPTVTVWPQNPTTYSVEVRDSRNCISLPKLITVTVFPRPLTSVAIPTINSVPTNTVCFVGLNPGAQDVTINLTAINGNTNLQFGIVPTYTWISPYGSNYNSILTPANNNAITVNAPLRLLNNSSVAVYTVISGYNGISGCREVDTVSIRVVDCRPIRDIKFTTAEDNDTICARNCITFAALTDTMAGGPQTYTWTFAGGAPRTSTLQFPTVCYNLPGSFNVILRVANPYPVVNASGPPGSENAIGALSYIKVVDVPNVTIVAPGQLRSDTTVRFGQTVSLKGSGALTYEWSPPYNITSLTNPKVTVSPLRTTQYILTGYNSKKCASSDTINVIVIDDCGEMYVPNAFTPNNDGNNDVLYVRGICLQSLTFMIFNRWGEKVFETKDQKLGWDGTYKGEEMNTGVFVYRLEGKTYDGKGFSSKGNITLIR